MDAGCHADGDVDEEVGMRVRDVAVMSLLEAGRGILRGISIQCD